MGNLIFLSQNSFGTDQRMKGTNSYQPGPGQYDPKSGDGGKSVSLYCKNLVRYGYENQKFV